MFDELLQIISDKFKIETVSFHMSETIEGVERNIVFVIFNKIKDEHITGIYILAKNSESEMKKELKNILNNGFSKPFKGV